MDSQMRSELRASAKHMMGVLGDRTTILAAKVTGFEKDSLGIAVVKATLQDENVPKEKHVRNLKIAVGTDQPQSQVLQVLGSLCERFDKKAGWLVMLKGLIVFHRLVAESDQNFQETVFKFQKAKSINSIFQAYGLKEFADFTNRDAQHFSAFIRVYASYLDERLEAFRYMKFDPSNDTGDSRLKTCSAADLLDRLPRAQRLLGALLDCVPEGAAVYNNIVRYAARMVLSESKAIYRLVSEGIMNLADKYFEMSLEDALTGLELYKKSVTMNDRLNGFFSAMHNIPGLKGAVQVPNLQALPADFLTTMEDYVREAPRESEKSRKGTGPMTVRTSTMAARGGLTSAALAGASSSATPAPPPPAPEPTPPPPPPPAPAPPPPEVDLLNFGPESPQKKAIPKEKSGPLDMLVEGPSSSNNGFGDSAWGDQQQQQQQFGNGQQQQFGNGHHVMQPTGYEYQQQQTGMDPYAQGYGGMPSMMPPPMQNGYGGYPQMGMGMGMGVGPYAGPTGFGGSAYAETQALVLYNPGAMMMGLPGQNPFMQGPPLPPAAPVNANNPFTTSTIPGVSGTTAPSQSMFQGTRLANDPLNVFTEELLGKSDEPKRQGPPLREMRRSTQNSEISAPVQGAIMLG